MAFLSSWWTMRLPYGTPLAILQLYCIGMSVHICKLNHEYFDNSSSSLSLPIQRSFLPSLCKSPRHFTISSPPTYLVCKTTSQCRISRPLSPPIRPRMYCLIWTCCIFQSGSCQASFVAASRVGCKHKARRNETATPNFPSTRFGLCR
jgi:hypothetical protein